MQNLTKSANVDGKLWAWYFGVSPSHFYGVSGNI